MVTALGSKPIDRDRQLPTFRHRFHAIEQEIDEDLMKLLGVAIH